MVGAVVSAPRYISNLSQPGFETLSAGFILSGLETALDREGHASLFLSGGSTPVPVYEKLSRTGFPWENVNIGLVDDRWVPETDPGSNAALIRKYLLKNGVKAAPFTPLKTSHGTALLGQSTAEQTYTIFFNRPALAVIGMGTDGHICSWFPKAKGLKDAIDPQNKKSIQAITAKPSQVTGSYLERISLTLHALCQCYKILLLISGDEKRFVLERAMDSNAYDYPVSHLLNVLKTKVNNPLTILHAS